ncbi:TPA: hypothetical protein ACN33D_004743 [Vibrio parahaemolyticus]
MDSNIQLFIICFLYAYIFRVIEIKGKITVCSIKNEYKGFYPNVLYINITILPVISLLEPITKPSHYFPALLCYTLLVSVIAFPIPNSINEKDLSNPKYLIINWIKHRAQSVLFIFISYHTIKAIFNFLGEPNLYINTSMLSILSDFINTSDVQIKHVPEPLLILISLGGVYRFVKICSRSIGEKILPFIITMSGASIILVTFNIYWLLAQSPYNLDSPESQLGGGVALFVLFVHDWLILLNKHILKET